MRRRAAVLSAVCTVAFSFAVPLFAQAPAAVSAKIWTDRAPEIEAYLKTAEVVGMEDLKVGVTKPRRAKLAPGGPVEAFSWKAIRPEPRRQRRLQEGVDRPHHAASKSTIWIAWNRGAPSGSRSRR